MIIIALSLFKMRCADMSNTALRLLINDKCYAHANDNWH